MGKIILVLSVLLILIFLMSAVKADTTFFENEEDVFIRGNPSITSNEITGIIKENEIGEDGSCLTNWVCSSWSNCINNTQLRNCAKEKSYCYADLNKKPIESQNCSIEKQKPEPIIEKENKEIKIFIFVFIIIASIILFAYKKYRKIRHKKYGY